MFVYNVIFSCTTLFGIVQSQQSVGELCTIQSTGSQGVCKLFVDCEQAVDDLHEKGTQPQRCGFQGYQTIVCCQNPSSITSTTSTLTISPPSRKTGEISKQKCREYANYIIELELSPILSGDEPLYILRKECGHDIVPLIVGGVLAKRKEFPHMAVLGYGASNNIKWGCGGTIISDQYILTAGHCLKSREYGYVNHVRIGVTNLNIRSRYKQTLAVSERIPHPDYKRSSHYNDIALLKLETPANLSSYSRPACLYGDRVIKTERAIATGWGATETEERSDDLNKVILDIFDHPTCSHAFRRRISGRLAQGILDETQVCAGSKNETKDTCQGDSGGPLQIYHTGDDIKCMYDIVGVTSFGTACLGTPAIYTRLSHYLKWIEDIVWPETSSS